MDAAEQLHKELNLGMYQVLASLSEDLKIRESSPTSFRDRFDSASTFQSFPPQYQNNPSVVSHSAMDPSAGMTWPTFPPHGAQRNPSNTMQGMHEGELPLYPVYRPQP